MAHHYSLLRICITLSVSLVSAPMLAQASYSTDTAYVSTALRDGEAIESQNEQKAIDYYQKGLAVAQKAGYTKGYFEAVRLLTFAYNTVGRHDEARQLAREALVRAEKDTSNRYRSIAHMALAITATRQGDIKEAIRHYEQAATYVRQSGRLDNVAVIYNNLGILCQRQHLFDQALAYHAKARVIREKLPNNARDLASTLFNIGSIYGVQDKYGPQKSYSLKAITLLDPERDLDLLVAIYNNMGVVYRHQNNYDSCFYFLNKALLLTRRMGNPSEEVHLLTTMAEAHNARHRPDLARLLLNRAQVMMDTLKPGLPEQQALLIQLVNTAELSGDFKGAYQWLDQYTNNKDSLMNSSIREQLEGYDQKMRQAEAREKIAEKQAQIARLEADQRRQTMWLWIAGMAVLALLVGGGLGWLYYRQRQKTAAAALLAAQQDQELTVIRSELAGQQKERTRISKEMHDDLGASMTAIGLLSEVAKTRVDAVAVPEVGKISEISAAMVTSMNEIIWSLNTRNDSLNGLIAYIRVYAREFIDNTPLRLKIEVDESPDEVTIRGVDRRNVFLTVKEALNNVVKHAHATEVTLRMRPHATPTKDGTFHVDVCDNGQGFDPASLAHAHRNGLTNMQVRLQESGGTCVVRATGQGTCVEIRFPYQRSTFKV